MAANIREPLTVTRGNYIAVKGLKPDRERVLPVWNSRTRLRSRTDNVMFIFDQRV
jgi:hypothetical protein